MKKSIPILLAVLLCLCTQTFAQNRADELMKQAQENLAKKEYIKARYLFLQAYNAFATQENYAQAVKCGVNASALYHRENYYKEAFELLRNAELLVRTGEQNSKRTFLIYVSASTKNVCKCTSASETPPVPKNS